MKAENGATLCNFLKTSTACGFNGTSLPVLQRWKWKWVDTMIKAEFGEEVGTGSRVKEVVWSASPKQNEKQSKDVCSTVW